MKIRDLKEKFWDGDPQVGQIKATRGSYRNQRERIDLFGSGWSLIGEGAFAKVYENPEYPDQVLKILGGTDHGWIRFYSLARRTDNVHFPEVSRMGMLNRDGYSKYAVLMEKLNRSPLTGNLAKQFYDAVTNYMYNENSYLDLVTDIWPELPEACEMLKRVFDKEIRLRRRGWDPEYAYDKGYAEDLSWSNLMWRGNVGVFTDPMVGHY